MEKEILNKMKNDTKYILKILQDNNFNQELVEKYQKKFLIKYQDYYKKSGFLQKLSRLKMYLYNNEKFQNIKIANNKPGLSYLEKIDLGYNILNSDVSDYQKIYEISQLFRNSEILLNKIVDFLIPYLNNTYIKRAVELYLFFSKHDDIIEKIKIDYQYLEDFKIFKNNYNYAEFIINEYILDQESYHLNSFFDKYGIDSDTFAFCVLTIENLNPELFNLYIKKYQKDKHERFNANLYTMKNIVHGIKTGYLFDGSEFDELKFWRIVPFINRESSNNEFLDLREIDPNITRHHTFNNRLRDFSLRFLLDDHSLICKYLNEYKIVERSVLYFTDDIYDKVNYQINSRVVTKKDITLVVNYMRNNNYPMIRRVFALIIHKYFNNEIDINQNSNNEKEKVLLIP